MKSPKKLFSVTFSKNPDGTMGVSTEMHAHYDGPDLLRVMVGAVQGLTMGTMNLAEKLGVTEEEVAEMLEQPVETNCKSRD